MIEPTNMGDDADVSERERAARIENDRDIRDVAMFRHRMLTDQVVDDAVARSVNNVPDVGSSLNQTAEYEPKPYSGVGIPSAPIPCLFDIRHTQGASTVDMYLPTLEVWYEKDSTGTMQKYSLSGLADASFGWVTLEIEWGKAIYCGRNNNSLYLADSPTGISQDGYMQICDADNRQLHRGIITFGGPKMVVNGDADITTPVQRSVHTRDDDTKEVYNISDTDMTADTNTKLVVRKNDGSEGSEFETGVSDLVAGTNVTITRDGNGFTIASSGGSGTVDEEVATPVQKTLRKLEDGSIGIDLRNTDGDPSSSGAMCPVLDNSGAHPILRWVAWTPL